MRTADRAFVALAAIALPSSALLLALLLSLLPRVPRAGMAAADAVAASVVLLALIGLALGVASLSRQLWSTLQLLRGLLARRVAPDEAVLREARELCIAERVDVVDDARPFSFTYWFARPRICLSTGLLARLEPLETRAVLAHERCHLARRDPLRLVAARSFAAALYVVPLVDDLVAHFGMLKEIAADEDAVRALGAVRPLARALYKLMPHASGTDLGLLAPVGGLTVTEARIEQLVERRPIALVLPPAHVALSAATLLGAAILSFGPFPLGEPIVAAASLGGIVLAAVPGVSHQLRAVTQR